MAVVFPVSPTLDQQFFAGGRQFVWDGSSWRIGPLTYAILDGGDATTELVLEIDIADGGDA